MVNQAKIYVLKLNDGKGNMALIFREYAYPTTILAGFHWSVLLCIYSILVCPFLAGMPAHTLLSLYATSVILTALCIQSAQNRTAPDTAETSPATSFCIQILIWTMLGCAIATFNALTFDFPPGSAEKVIIGFGFLGIYNAVSGLLRQQHKQLKPRQLQALHFWLRYGVITLPVVIAVMTIWIINVQLATYWADYPLPARSPEQIVLASTLFMLLIAILISQNLLRSGFRILNSQARQLLLSIDRRANTLNPSHHCEFKSVRQPDIQILNNPAYQQKIIHRLRALKYLDPVTGTHNARFIKDFLNNRHQQEPDLQLHLLLIEIKEQPAENVLHYRDDSDVIQAKAAQRIHQFLMAEDILARLDNNCFAVIPANPERLDESHFIRCLKQNLQQQPLILNNRSAYVKCKISRQSFLMHSANAGADYAFHH